MASGSRARIRTSVERTKTACPAWLDDPGMLRRKLYPEAGPGPAERVGRARGVPGGRPPGLALRAVARMAVGQQAALAAPAGASRGVDQAGLPCMSAECPMLASADSEVGELLRM